MVQSAVRSWFDWKDWKDNPVFWFQRVPVWLETQAVARSIRQADNATSLQFVGDVPDSRGEPILLACCDEVYFYRFARHLAASGHQASPDLFIHIHIYEASSRCLEDAAALRRRLGSAPDLDQRVAWVGRRPGRPNQIEDHQPEPFDRGKRGIAADGLLD